MDSTNTPAARSAGGLGATLRPHFVAAAAFSLVLNLLLLVPSLFMLQVFDRVLTSRSTETLVMLLLLTAGALAFMAWLDVIRARLLGAAAVTLERRLGPQVLGAMIRRNAASSGGERVHGLRDLGTLRAFLTGPGVLSLFDAPWVPVYVLVIFLFHPLLGAIALAGALAMLALGVLNEALSRGAHEAMQAEARHAGRLAEQAVANAEVARVLGMADRLAAGWEGFSERSLQHQLQASRMTSVLTALTRLMRQLLQVAMLAVGAWLVIGEAATPGVMIAGTILLARALAPVETAIAGWKSLVDTRSACARLQGLLGAETAADAGTELPTPRGELSVERVTFGFRGEDRAVLRQVSFALTPGQSLAIVGPSASGKSTLARLIVGLWKPSMGVVRLDGANITHWPRAHLGPHLGYLPQDVELFAGTVAQNIARLDTPDAAAVTAAAQRAQAHDMILRLPQGYDTPIGPGGVLLSAGQRQRIGLGRALYGRPRLVVLDEPNSNLDAEGEAALLGAIRQMKLDRVTLVIVTHRSMLLSAMDRVLLLRDGALERFGPPAAVLARPAALAVAEGAPIPQPVAVRA